MTEELSSIDKAFSNIVSVFPQFLSWGTIGVGAISLTLFIILARRDQSIFVIGMFSFLSIFMIGVGAYLELSKSPDVVPTIIPKQTCTNDAGKFGTVQIRLHIFNNEKHDSGENKGQFKGHGFDQIGLPSAENWLVSTFQVKDLKSNSEGDYLNKRWGAQWKCIVPPE